MAWPIPWEVPISDHLALRMGEPRENYSEQRSGAMRAVQEEEQ
jgi:hypothetical protein